MSNKKKLTAKSLYTISERESVSAVSRVDIAQKLQTTRCFLANDNPFLLMAFRLTLSKHFDVVDTA